MGIHFPLTSHIVPVGHGEPPIHEEEFVGVGFDLLHQFNWPEVELPDDEPDPFTQVPVPPNGLAIFPIGFGNPVLLIKPLPGMRASLGPAGVPSHIP